MTDDERATLLAAFEIGIKPFLDDEPRPITPGECPHCDVATPPQETQPGSGVYVCDSCGGEVTRADVLVAQSATVKR